MSKNLLLEIGTEEIPHAVLTDTIRQFKEKSLEKLQGAGIEFGKIFVYATPRRIAVQLIDIEDKTASRTVEKRGPDVRTAFDANGNPTPALLGFLKSNQADVKDIEKRDLKGSIYVFLTKKEGGDNAVDILPGILKAIIASIDFPKAMRWGNYKTTFVRPIRWIVCVMDKDTLDFSIENIRSGKYSMGHRLLHNDHFAIENPLNYKNSMKEKDVIVDQDERRALILDMIEKTAERLKAVPVINDGLLDTLTNLTEFPKIAVGKFEKEFLSLPQEVLISEMIDHQKYVPLRDQNGDLMNNFIITANIQPNNNVVTGNERVIRSRFKDGKFFFDEDRKHKLGEYTERLKEVDFARGLGTLFDKIGRLQTIIQTIAPIMGYDAVIEDAKRAAELCKADLVTGMVNEFDELQGVMGYYYALHSGEKKNVALAIREHYLPKFSGDELPTTKEGILLALADRLDNLFAMYAKGSFVSGSKDPYALRRQTLGIIRIFIEKTAHIDLSKIVESLLPVYKPFMTIKEDEFKKQIFEFITTRVKTVFKETKFAYDEIEAGIMSDVFDVFDAYQRIQAIHSARNAEDFENLAIAFKRVKNILKGQKRGSFSESLLKEEAEKALSSEFASKSKSFAEALAKREYATAVGILTSFRPAVDKFFTDVLVMDKDEMVKTNRIALLSKIDELFMQFIDFEKIVIE